MTQTISDSNATPPPPPPPPPAPAPAPAPSTDPNAELPPVVLRFLDLEANSGTGERPRPTWSSLTAEQWHRLLTEPVPSDVLAAVPYTDPMRALQEQVRRAQERLTQAQQRHRDDIRIIGERLIEEAGDHGWCDQYDQVIDELNAELSVDLPLRSRNYRVACTVTIYVEVQTTTEDAAERKARQLLSQIEDEVDALPDVATSSFSTYDLDVEEQ